jgi:hypothetical protein
MSTKMRWRNGIATFYDGTTQESMPVAPFVLYDDFEGTVIRTVAAGVKGWTVKDTAGGAETILANQHGGILSLALTAGNEKQEAGIYLGDALNFNLDKGPIFECRAAVHTAPTDQGELYFGLTNAYVEGPIAEADAGPTVHALFMFDGGLVCTIHTDDTANDNDAKPTGVTAVLDAFHVFRIDFTTASDVKFFIDGVAVGTATTFDMSTGANVVTQPFIMAHKETGTGVAELYVDYVKVWSAR